MLRTAATVIVALVAMSGAATAQTAIESEAEQALEAGEYDRGIALYTQVVEQAGSEPGARASALFDRAEVYGRSARSAEALADYTEALSLSTDPAFKALVLFGRADLHAMDRHYAEAIADYTAAAELNPGLVGVRLARGTAYRRMKNDAAALADFNAELALNPTYPKALRARAQMLGQPDPTARDPHPFPDRFQ